MDKEALFFLIRKTFKAYAEAHDLQIASLYFVLTVLEKDEIIGETATEKEAVSIDGIAQIVAFIPGDEFETVLEN
jgi:hypothetical protein